MMKRIAKRRFLEEKIMKRRVENNRKTVHHKHKSFTVYNFKNFKMCW